VRQRLFDIFLLHVCISIREKKRLVITFSPRAPVLRKRSRVEPQGSTNVQELVWNQRYEYLRECGLSIPIKVVRVQIVKLPQSVFNTYVNLYGRVVDARPEWAVVKLEYAYPYTGRLLRLPLNHFHIVHEK
jgi:hypothetical protein